MSGLPLQVGRYERTIQGSLERVWENVHDWEHLPWLHHASFASIACLDSGDWGWRARVGLPPASDGAEIVIELRLRPGEQAYDVTTLEGPGTGTVIATRLRELAPEETGVGVGFHVPGVGSDAAASVGAGFAALYERLWDEDQAMIEGRARALATPPPAVAAGSAARLGERRSLKLPLDFEIAGRAFRLVEWEGRLVAHDQTCPHRLGPLADGPDAQGRLVCPWHGYAFDVCTGRSRGKHGLRLLAPPRVDVDAATGEVTVTVERRA